LKRCGWLFIVVVLLLTSSVGLDAKKRTKRTPTNPKKHQQLTKKLQVVENRIKNVRIKLKVKKLEKAEVSARLQLIEGQLNVAQTSLQRTQDQLDSSRDMQLAIANRLQITKDKLALRRTLLAKRIHAGFVEGRVETVSVILGSRSMRDLMSRGDAFQRISAQDNKLYKEVREMKNQLAADKLVQDGVVKEVSRLENTQKAEATVLYNTMDEKSKILKQVENDEQLLKEQLDELAAQSQQIEQSIQALYKTPAFKNRAQVRWHGSLQYPQARISSSYGMRVHPIAHVYKMHTGTDYSMGYGTPIHAAADGIVIAARSMGGYGNVVIIDHGSSISTLYGHCSSLSVSDGQSVKSGQVVAYVGSTGYSTGPHLHFEVRKNGKPIDPMSFH
jgi:murein DD-endopeptidase MepM/ murein hydrolase activator NlpD